MSLSMYDVSVPVFQRQLGQLSHLLDLGLAHAKEASADPASLVQARLAPDMLPLAKQVQIACDSAKLAVGRLSGVEAPKFEDTETTFEELQKRVADTLAWMATVPRTGFDGSEARQVTIKTGKGEVTFTGQAYLLHFALPNFFFHVTTAYGVLRNQGVAIGKSDYLGQA